MKETKKQLKGQIVNELSKRYAEKLKRANENTSEWYNRYSDALHDNKKLRQKNRELEEENDRLREKLKTYEDWVERMQDFCNLPESERQTAMTEYMTDMKATSNLKDIISSMWFPFMNAIL